MVLFLIVLFILLPRKHFFFLVLLLFQFSLQHYTMKPAPKSFKLFYGFLKPLIPERIPLHVFPSLVRYLLREHFTFDPIKDPTICPLFGQDGVRCWKCGGQTRLEFHDRFGPRLVHGMARDFYVMGVSLECLNKFGCKKPVFLSECQIY